MGFLQSVLRGGTAPNPAARFLNLLWGLCKRHGALFYLDEAATGFDVS